MPEDNSLEGKVVVSLEPKRMQIGILEKDNPPTLAQGYLTITGGAGVETNILVNSNSGVVQGELRPYNPSSLAGDLQKYRCQGVQTSKLVAAMVQGAYGNRLTEQPEEDPVI